MALALMGCQSTTLPPLKTVPQVDLPRFMGDWYVIANIPTFIEKGAHNAVESYRLDKDGTIATTFTFRAGSFTGESKRYTPRAFVRNDPSNAIWGMQFIWPIKADFRITYLAADYSLTIISREARDYVWIMARMPVIAEAEFQRLAKIVAEQGYDMNKLQRVPQQWP
jgi:apolipoprotein D and lipocalin family protein